MSSYTSWDGAVKDIASYYPDSSADMITQLIPLLIDEVMRDAILKVRVSGKPLSKFDLKKRFFRNMRRPLSSRRDREYSWDNDPEVIVRTSKSIYKNQFEPRDTTVWNQLGAEYSYSTPGQVLVEQYASNTMITPTIGEPVLGINLGEDETQLLTVGTQVKKGSSDKYHYDESFSSFEMSKELLSMCDTSMTKGRFFSFIRKESEKFSKAYNIRLKFNLSARIENSLINNLVLTMSGFPNNQAIEMKTTAEHLHEFIMNKLMEKLLQLGESDRNEYLQLIEGLSVIPDENELLRNKEKIKLTHKLPNQSFEFDDLREICNFILLNNDSDTVNRITSLVNKDIEIKNEKYGIDCRQEFRKNKQLLLNEGLIGKQTTGADSSLKENIRALLLFEYNRLSKEDSAAFLSGKIGYESYLERNQKYTDIVLDLW